MLKLREVDDTASPKWDKLVNSSQGGTIFHTVKWLRVIEKNQPLRLEKLGIFLGRELIGILPLFFKKFVFIKVAASPFVIEDTPYLGPVIERSQILDLLSALDGYLKKNGIAFLRMMSSEAYHAQDRQEPYQFIEKHTHLLDLTESEDTLWKKLEGRCRTAIRKAQKSKVTAFNKTDRGFIDEYYPIIEDVYHAQKLPFPNRKSFYYDMWDAFGPTNVILLSAKYHGETIAGIIIVTDGKRAYYLNGASKSHFRALSPSNLLLWEAINILKQRGVEQFDFVGSDIPRLAKFKKSFGGELTKHTLIERASSNWVALLRNAYPIYKRKVGNILGKFTFNP